MIGPAEMTLYVLLRREDHMLQPPPPTKKKFGSRELSEKHNGTSIRQPHVPAFNTMLISMMMFAFFDSTGNNRGLKNAGYPIGSSVMDEL